MPSGPKTSDDQFSEEETVRRRDAVIKRMISTPPKPHSEMKVDKNAKTQNPKKGK